MRFLAYIDLPSGSAIFQFLIAGLLGLSVAFRSFWAKAWAALTGRRRREAAAGEGSSASAEGNDHGAGEPSGTGKSPGGTKPVSGTATGTASSRDAASPRG